MHEPYSRPPPGPPTPYGSTPCLGQVPEPLGPTGHHGDAFLLSCFHILDTTHVSLAAAPKGMVQAGRRPPPGPRSGPWRRDLPGQPGQRNRRRVRYRQYVRRRGQGGASNGCSVVYACRRPCGPLRVYVAGMGMSVVGKTLHVLPAVCWNGGRVWSTVVTVACRDYCTLCLRCDLWSRSSCGRGGAWCAHCWLRLITSV